MSEKLAQLKTSNSEGRKLTIIDLGTISYTYGSTATFTKVVTSYTDDYANLTLDNFFPREAGHQLDSSGIYNPGFNRTYNPSTGTIQYKVSGALRSGTAATRGSFHIYLVF